MEKKRTPSKPTHSYRFMYGYGLGEFGFTFFLFFIAYHLMYFMTDILCMPGTVAALVYTVIQWFEAVTMVGAGVLVDRASLKAGKYRPWMVIGAVMCMAFTVLFFTDFQLSVAGDVLIFGLFYFLSYTGYNLMWVAYRSMIGPLSRTPQDNVSLTTASSQLGSAAGLLFSFFGVAILYGFHDMRTGYLISALLYGGLMVIGMVISAFVTRRFDNKKTQAAHPERKKVSLKEMIRSINKPTIVFFLAVTFRESMSTLLPTLLTYYFLYVVGDSGWLSVYLTVINLSSLFGYFFAQAFANRFGKKNMFIISSFLSVCCILSVNLIGSNMILFMILMGLNAFCNIFSGTMIPAFMNEIADYNEYTQGIHARGFVMSLGGTAIRCAAVLGGALSSFGLVMIGYQPDMAVTPVFCSQLTRLMTFGAAAGLVISAVIFMFYSLDANTMARVYVEKAKEQETTDYI